MAIMQNFQRLQAKLEALQKEAKRQTLKSVTVGYTAAYAIYVHENREIWPPGMRLKGKPRPKRKGRYWDPQGKAQPKFLEEPARRLAPELGRIVAQIAKNGSVEDGLLAAGLRLQRESQKLVPVNTGNLKASAFTRAGVAR